MVICLDVVCHLGGRAGLRVRGRPMPGVYGQPPRSGHGLGVAKNGLRNRPLRMCREDGAPFCVCSQLKLSAARIIDEEGLYLVGASAERLHFRYRRESPAKHLRTRRHKEQPTVGQREKTVKFIYVVALRCCASEPYNMLLIWQVGDQKIQAFSSCA